MKDIRVWIVLYFVLNLFFISQPPLEPAHAWRQTLTNTIARNLAEGEGSMLYPKIDHGGDSQGIMASEFPVFQYLLSLSYKVTGHNHWAGRLINLFFSCLGYLAFYLIIKTYFNTRTAFYATLAMMCSLWFMYARKSMPDTFSVSLVLMSFYMFSSFIRGRHWMHLVLGTLILSLGILSKIPAVLIVVPLPLLLFSSSSLARKLGLVVGVMLAAIPVRIWYFKWVPYLVGLDNNPLFFPRSYMEGWQELKQYPMEILEQFTFHSFFSFVAFGLSVVGIYYMIKRRNWKAIAAFMASAVMMFLFMLKTGMVFPLHSYYMIPFIPIMALLIGYGLDQLPRYAGVVLILIVAVESIANQQDDFRIRADMYPYLKLEEIADAIDNDSTKVMCNGGDNPQVLYFLNRTGWSVNDFDINADTINQIRQRGGIYFYNIKKLSTHQNVYPYKRVLTNDFLEVYDIRSEDSTSPAITR